MKGLSVEDKSKLGINLSSELQDILVLCEHHDTEVHHFVLSEKRICIKKKNASKSFLLGFIVKVENAKVQLTVIHCKHFAIAVMY